MLITIQKAPLRMYYECKAVRHMQYYCPLYPPNTRNDLLKEQEIRFS